MTQALTNTLTVRGDLIVDGRGAMSVATTKPMPMLKNSGHPASGDVTLQMARSIVSVIARDSVTVYIGLNDNGDGTSESGSRTSWRKFNPVH